MTCTTLYQLFPDNALCRVKHITILLTRSWLQTCTYSKAAKLNSFFLFNIIYISLYLLFLMIFSNSLLCNFKELLSMPIFIKSILLNFLCPRPEKSAGASSNQIVRLSVCQSVCLFPLCLYKVQYLRCGWWYSYQTWTISSSMDYSHLTDITCLVDKPTEIKRFPSYHVSYIYSS